MDSIYIVIHIVYELLIIRYRASTITTVKVYHVSLNLVLITGGEELSLDLSIWTIHVFMI